MKSVCIVVQQDYEVDIRVRRKAEALLGAGYSVDVLALRGSSRQKTYELNGVNVHTISLGKKRGSLVRYAFEYIVFFLWALIRVAVLMRKRHYVIIDVNNLPDFLVFCSLAARWRGAKVVLDMHEITPEFYMSKYGIPEESLLVRFLKWVEKISLDFADQVITINEPIQDLFISRGMPKEKSIVITNSAEESRFAPSLASCVSNIPTAKFVMMYHGTLTSIYGLDIAIEAFALAHKDMPGAEFWILGPGPEKAALHKLAEERGIASNVKLVGQVPVMAVGQWLARCDVGVLPLRRDVFLDFASPNKLPEYIVMSKPVVISRLKAIRYYFSEDALAYFEPNDPGDLAKQMVRLYRDSDLRTRLAATATREYAPIRWAVMKERYLRLVEQMVGPAFPSGKSSTLPAAVGVAQ